ncbi:hypothetical protein OHB01_34390 [Microbispora hainanensis]|uniref:Uncharacterized protein n=1 Tax=Microbispora hainanensis TaxID=568844 RepID=A0ABZ1T1E8_9ACTN|nr:MULTISPECIES: hypothetical protein [Microbispora]NJP25136.1 hypothetical protein [Microbispora sp. CL1-1]TQS14040.1 hypothetical protein FLW53_13125 [Microbispora sp. SCL1-1]
MVKRAATTLVAVAMGATALATAPAYADTVAPTSTPTPSPSAGHTFNKPHKPDSHQPDFHKPYKPDPRILSVDVSPNVVVVSKGRSAQVTARVTTKDVQSVDIDLWGPGVGHGGHGGNHWFGKQKSGHNGPKLDHTSRTWSFDWNDRAGTYKVHVVAVGLDGKKYTTDRSFTVKRKVSHAPRPTGPKATRIAGFDATPEPVRKGRSLTLKGTLQVAQCWGDWYYGWNDFTGRRGGARFCSDSNNYWNSWHWLGSQTVKVYFQPSGSHKWQYVNSVKTAGDGDFATKVRAFRSGTWAVRFDGGHGLKGSQATDYVKVVRH